MFVSGLSVVSQLVSHDQIWPSGPVRVDNFYIEFVIFYMEWVNRVARSCEGASWKKTGAVTHPRWHNTPATAQYFREARAGYPGRAIPGGAWDRLG